MNSRVDGEGRAFTARRMRSRPEASCSAASHRSISSRCAASASPTAACPASASAHASLRASRGGGTVRVAGGGFSTAADASAVITYGVRDAACPISTR